MANAYKVYLDWKTREPKLGEVEIAKETPKVVRLAWRDSAFNYAAQLHPEEVHRTPVEAWRAFRLEHHKILKAAQQSYTGTVKALAALGVQEDTDD